MDTPTTTLAHYQMYIDGLWTDSTSGNYFESDNPYPQTQCVWIATATEMSNPFVLR